MEEERLMESIIVGGFTITVVDKTHEMQLQGLSGAFIGAEGSIQIRTDYKGQLQAETLVHEVMEVVNHVYLEGSEITHPQLSMIAQGLFQIIVDNPHLIRKVQELSASSRDEIEG